MRQNKKFPFLNNLPDLSDLKLSDLKQTQAVQDLARIKERLVSLFAPDDEDEPDPEEKMQSSDPDPATYVPGPDPDGGLSDPVPEYDASEPGQESVLSSEEPEAFAQVFSQILTVPAGDDWRMMLLCHEMSVNRGEDYYIFERNGDEVFLGVFDGCGGSGAKVYRKYAGNTGAWVASRTAAKAAAAWFASNDGNGLQADADGADNAALSGLIAQALENCRAVEKEPQLLLGSLSREFPTTVAAFRAGLDDDKAYVYWCGDSRCYVLDEEGLHQVSADDSAIQDAMRALREDAPMTNVACASHPFVLHRKALVLEKPCLLFAATDGCFGYLPSPMAFEHLLLDTLIRSGSTEDWKNRLEKEIGKVAGDDYTWVCLAHRFSSFRQMKRLFRKRYARLDAAYPAAADETQLARQWTEYKPGYESMLTDLQAGRTEVLHDRD